MSSNSWIKVAIAIILLACITLCVLFSWPYLSSGLANSPRFANVNTQTLYGSQKDVSVRLGNTVFFPGMDIKLEVDIGTANNIAALINKIVIESKTEVLYDSPSTSDFGTITITQPRSNKIIETSETVDWKIPQNAGVNKNLDLLINVNYVAARRTGINSYSTEREEIAIPLKIWIMSYKDAQQARDQFLYSQIINLACWVMTTLLIGFLARKYCAVKYIRIIAYIATAMVGVMTWVLICLLSRIIGGAELVQLAFFAGIFVALVPSVLYGRWATYPYIRTEESTIEGKFRHLNS